MAPGRPSQRSFTLAGFFAFRSLAGGRLIQATYLVGAIVWTLVMLDSLYVRASGLPWGPTEDPGFRWSTGTIVWLLFGHMVWRVLCEGLIVLFRMHDALVAIEDNSRSPTRVPAKHGADHL